MVVAGATMAKPSIRSGNSRFDVLLIIAVAIILMATQALATLSQRLAPLETILNGVTGPILRAIARHFLPMDVWFRHANKEQLILLESLVFSLLGGFAVGVCLLYRKLRSRDKQQHRPHQKKRP